MARSRGLTAHERERVVAKLKELRAAAKSQDELAQRLGIKQSSLSNILNGRDSLGLTVARAVAEACGMTLESLISGTKSAAPRFEDHTGLQEADQQAREVYARTIPPWAFDAAGSLMAYRMPSVIDATVVAGFAEAWKRSSSDDERSNAIADQARREMAAIDEEKQTPAKRKRSK